MKKIVSLVLALCLLASLSVTAFAASGVIGVDDVEEILAAMTGQISVATIMAVLVVGISSAIGFVFMWWSVRKLLKTFMAGFRKGRVEA